MRQMTGMNPAGKQLRVGNQQLTNCWSDDRMVWDGLMGIIGVATFAPRDEELRVQLNQQMEIENHRKMFQYQA